MRRMRRFERNILILVSGTGVAQLLPILASPVIARLYGPAGFGYFAVATSIIGIIGVAATGKYEQALLLPDDDLKAWNLAAAALLSALFISLMTLGVLCGFYLTGLLVPELAWFLWVIPLGVFLYSSLQTFVSCANRLKNYKAMAQNRALQSFVSVTIQIVVGLMFPQLGALGLLIGFLVGHALAVALIAFRVGCVKWIEKIQLSRELIWQQAKRYRLFPLFGMPNALANVASRQAPNLMLAFFFGAPIAGFYSMSNRLVSAPLGLLGNSVGQVFFETAARKHNQKENLSPLVSRIYKRLFLVSLIPFAVILLYAPQLFTWVLGQEWLEAGKYAQVLIPWIMMMFLNSPVVPVLAVLERQKTQFTFEMALLVSRVSAILIGAIAFSSPYVAVCLFGGVGFVFNLFLFFYINYLVRRPLTI